jgi:D-beta-D-heptose 7-phosphate kinase/D-beta-D-heptose 1-phosphate adenosyltransferase
MDTILAHIRGRLSARPPTIMVVGDVMLDRYLRGRCHRISPEAPVQVVDVLEETVTLGGAGNVAANLASLGARVRVATAIGEDAQHAILMRLLSERGIDTRGVVALQGRPATTKTRILAGNHQVVRYDVEDRTPLASSQEAELLARVQSALDGCDAVVVSDYNKGVVSAALCREVIKAATRAKLPVLCDPKGGDWTKYANATVVTPNRKEATEVTQAGVNGMPGLRTVAQHIQSHYQLDAVLITLGEEGMALLDRDDFHHFPTVAREVFDVTGAGDTVIAALAFAHACGRDLPDACRFANAAAGIAVSRVGTTTVTLGDIERVTQSRPAAGDKVQTAEAVQARCHELRRRGKRIVFTNGCFDVLHVGHVKLLEGAAALGDVLVVGLNSDASVEELKPGRPIVSQADRAYLLASMAAVDYVVVFDEETPARLIDTLRPDVLVKGGDYIVDDIVGADVVLRNGGAVHTIPFVEGRSTTELLNRIREAP